MSLQQIIKTIICVFGLIILVLFVCFDELTEQLKTALCIITPCFLVVMMCIKLNLLEF